MKTKIKRMKKLILVMLLSIGLLGVQQINTKAASGAFKLKDDITLNTINNANLVSASFYVNNDLNKPFDSMNSAANTANGYVEYKASVSGRNIVLDDTTGSGSVTVVAVAKDANGVEYYVGFVPKWETNRWVSAGGYQKTAVGDTITIGYRATDFYPNVIQLGDLNITNINASYEYTGGAITPAPTVKLKESSIFNSTGADISLVTGTHYTLGYSANTNIGTAAKTTLTFKTPYMGVVEKTFAITAKTVSKADIKASLDQLNYPYTGNPVAPVPTIVVGGKTLINGTDYTVTYPETTKLGSYTATVTLKGNYSGSTTIDYSIADMTDAFVNLHLGGSTNPYKTATLDNYSAILTGEAEYLAMTDGQKALINGKLTPTTYPELLNAAKVIDFQTDYKGLLNKTVASKNDFGEINKALAELNASPVKDKLTSEKTKLTSLLGATTFLKDNNKIIAQNTVTLADKAALDKAIADYEALDVTSKALVDSDVVANLYAKKNAMSFLEKNKDILSKKKEDLTDNELKTIKAVLNEYSLLDKDVNSVIDDSIKGLLNDFNDFVKESEFIKTYVSDPKGTVYTGTNASNYEQILSGKETWGKMTQDQKDAINKTLVAEGSKTYEELIAAAQKLQDEVNDFIDTFVTDNNGTVYKKADAKNYEQILSGKETWDKMTQDQKDAINKALVADGSKTYEELIAESESLHSEVSDFIKTYVTDQDGTVYKEVNADNYIQIHLGTDSDFGNWEALNQDVRDAINQSLKDKVGKTYEELIAEMNAMVSGIDDFVNKYLVDSKDNLYKEATSSNYKQILSGQDDWAKLTQDQQKAINDLLVANGGKTYEELIAAAQEMEANTQTFINQYLTGKDGNVYKIANNNNYKQILSGKDVWNKLTQLEKDIINNQLKDNGGKTYEELLAMAERLAKGTKTEDNTAIEMYTLFGLVSIGGIVFLNKKRKYALKD